MLMLLCVWRYSGADVPPPLPVKQRCRSAMSDHELRLRDNAVLPSLSSASNDDGRSQRHTTSPSSTHIDSLLVGVLTDLSEASAPKKPPRGTFRLSSYDNCNNRLTAFLAAASSDGSLKHFSSSSREMIDSVNCSMLATTVGVTSNMVLSAADPVSAAMTGAPPLPMKLRHSESALHLLCIVLHWLIVFQLWVLIEVRSCVSSQVYFFNSRIK